MIWIVLLIAASPAILLVLYHAAMNIERVDGKKPTGAAAVILLLAVVWDWLCNMVTFTIIFLDIPRSWRELVTGRLKRYVIDQQSGCRGRLAMWIADKFLDKYDPSGKHV